MPKVYAVLHDGKGEFMIAYKNLRGYFFHNPRGAGGSIIPAGQPLNGANYWALPGGNPGVPLDTDEQIIDAAIKELMEETGIEVGTSRCTPAIYRGEGYYGVYFWVDGSFSQMVTEGQGRLRQGRLAAAAVQAGTYTQNDQYAALLAAFNCPDDNELANVYPWNLFEEWHMIEELQHHVGTDWYYTILLNLRNQLFLVKILDLHGRIIGIGLDLSFQPNDVFVVSNILYDGSQLLGEGEYIILYEGDRIEHVLFNPNTQQGGTGIFKDRNS